ncbi:MAG: GNAT family N-acetyltransferase [Candidatus Limnocylindria bacterium]
MPLPDDLSMRTAALDDLRAIAALRLEVGMAPHNWALRLAIEPPNARCFVVEDRGGRLIAVGSGVAYDPLGFVGNMMVAEGRRREGIGSEVLGAVVDFLRGRRCTRLELFATSQGRPLYARHGFTPIEPGSRATLPQDLPLARADDIVVADADVDALGSLVTYDEPRFGGDRTPLLTAMLADPERPTLVARRAETVVGYGWLRVDEDRLGPWVADGTAEAAAILSEAFRRVPDHLELTANIPISNRPGVAWLRGLGVEPDPWDGRMALGAPIPRREESIFGNTAGALG